ncbi:putative LOC100569746 [Trichonephila clavipes]|nr:putative LOC100569746 [Trichonephila clavipes]
MCIRQLQGRRVDACSALDLPCNPLIMRNLFPPTGGCNQKCKNAAPDPRAEGEPRERCLDSSGGAVVQQDGATCHTACATIDLLKDTLGDRLISRFGPVNWPRRSCDLTPLDYFLWGYVKSLVYADKPQTLDHLEDNTRRVIADIRPQMLEKVTENWTSRLDYIRPSRGSHMPEIIFKICFSKKNDSPFAECTSANSVCDAICRFKELGNDDRRPESGRKRTVNNSRNRKRVQRNPRVSMRHITRDMRIGDRLVRQIAKMELRLKPYKLRKVQFLTEKKLVRLRRCRKLLRRAH